MSETKRRRGRPSHGFYKLIAAHARFLIDRGRESLVAITTAEEVLRQHFAPGARLPDGTVIPWRTGALDADELETVRRIIRRLRAEEDRGKSFVLAPQLKYELLAASDPGVEPLSDEAASLLAEVKINVRETRKALKGAIAEREKTKKNRQ